MTSDLSALQAALAPTGTLRAALNLSNFLLVAKDSPPDAPRGVAPDMARELARRLAVPVEFVRYENAGKVADAAPSGAWDVAFIGAEPLRANEIDFTAAYVELEATYLVPAGSPIRSIEEVDRPGNRIATADRSAYDLFLSRTIKHAQIMRAPGIDASFALFVDRKLEVLSGLKPRLLMDHERLPGSRILEGRFTAIQQAIGTPKGRGAGFPWLVRFVEDVKATGVVAEAIARNGVRGVSVAPRAAA